MNWLLLALSLFAIGSQIARPRSAREYRAATPQRLSASRKRPCFRKIARVHRSPSCRSRPIAPPPTALRPKAVRKRGRLCLAPRAYPLFGHYS